MAENRIKIYNGIPKDFIVEVYPAWVEVVKRYSIHVRGAIFRETCNSQSVVFTQAEASVLFYIVRDGNRLILIFL